MAPSESATDKFPNALLHPVITVGSIHAVLVAPEPPIVSQADKGFFDQALAEPSGDEASIRCEEVVDWSPRRVCAGILVTAPPFLVARLLGRRLRFGGQRGEF